MCALPKNEVERLGILILLSVSAGYKLSFSTLFAKHFLFLMNLQAETLQQWSYVFFVLIIILTASAYVAGDPEGEDLLLK